MKQINLQLTGVLNNSTHFRDAKSRILSKIVSTYARHCFSLSLLYFTAHKYITEQRPSIEFIKYCLR